MLNNMSVSYKDSSVTNMLILPIANYCDVAIAMEKQIWPIFETKLKWNVHVRVRRYILTIFRIGITLRVQSKLRYSQSRGKLCHNI